MKRILYIGTLLCIILTYFSIYPLNEDDYWVMYSTQHMLHGGELYVDIIETNPPLIFIISMLPISIADLLSVSLSSVYILFTILLSFFSVYLIRTVLRHSKTFSDEVIKYVTCGSLFILLIVPSGDFAQREHFMMIFVLPYIVISMFRDKLRFSKKLLLLVSLFAIFGFNLKPHFYLLFIVIEIFILIKTKRINFTEQIPLLIIGLSGFVYLAVIYMFFPQYYTFAIPLALEAYSGVFNKPLLFLIFNMDIAFAFFVFSYIFDSVKDKMKFDLLILYASLIALLLIYLLQQKGWHYQLLPFLMIAAFLLLYGSVIYVREKYNISMLLGILVLFTIIYNNIYTDRYSELNKLLSTLDKNVPVVVYTQEMAMCLPLVVQNSQQWSSRFLSLWMFKKVLQEKENSNLKKYILGAITEDLKKYKPAYIIFPTFYDKTDYYEYFMKNSDNISRIFRTKYEDLGVSDFIVLKRNVKK